MDGMSADALLADRGYDTNEIIEQTIQQDIRVVISSKRKRKVGRSYDKGLYKLCYFIGNDFLQLKKWRGVATRYAVHVPSFLAALKIRRIALWGDII